MIVNILLLLAAIVPSNSDTEISPKREEYEGTFTSDYETVSYSARGDTLYPEVCAWTVTFSKFDLHSISPNFDCSDSEIRIYPFTNKKVNFGLLVNRTEDAVEL